MPNVLFLRLFFLLCFIEEQVMKGSNHRIWVDDCFNGRRIHMWPFLSFLGKSIMAQTVQN